MSALETRTLYGRDGLQVIGEMHADTDAEVDQDFETPEQEADYRQRFARGDFMYVGMVAKVVYFGAEFAEDSLWAIEHGEVADGVTADAWENAPAQYEGNTVVMGSPLSGVVCEAISNAQKWAKSNGSDEMRSALAAAEAWADPNAR